MKPSSPSALVRRGSGVLLIAFLLALWEWAGRVPFQDDASLLPFSEVAAAWWRLLVGGELPRQVGVSLWRMAQGYLIASVLGIAFGIAMGYWRAIHDLLEPLVELIRPIPSPAYVPVVILFLGIGDGMKVAVIAIGCFFPVLVNTFAGVQSIDPVQINTGRTFGLNNRQLLRSIVLPAASPYVMAGLRISLAIALILAVIAEMIAANNGIGYFVINSQRVFRVADMYAGVVTLAIVGYSLNWLHVRVERRLLHWNVTGS